MKIQKSTNSLTSVSVGKWYIAFMIITLVIPSELKLVDYGDGITRPFGSAISLTIPMMLTFIFLFFIRTIHVPKQMWKTPIITYFCCAMISGIFLIINSGSVTNYIIAAIKFLVYIMMYLCVTGSVPLKSYEEGIDIGFKISLIIQTIVGWAYVFFGVLIPLIGNYSTSYRNGFSRMVGSFSHPGDFSLYMSIITLYFACRWLFSGKKTAIVFMLIAAIDVYFSGARTMLLFTVAAIAVIMLSRRNRNPLYKLGLVMVVIVAIPLVIQSDIFQELFVENSFVEMFQARFIHWIIGFKILFSNVQNFLFGVGLNSHVDYINIHFSEFSALVNASTVLDTDFARGSPIHNSYLVAGCELGIVGLVVYLRIYYTGLKDSVCIAKNKFDGENLYRGMFICWSLLAYMLYAIQGWALQKNFAITLLVILLGYLSVIKETDM